MEQKRQPSRDLGPCCGSENNNSHFDKEQAGAMTRLPNTLRQRGSGSATTLAFKFPLRLLSLERCIPLFLFHWDKTHIT